MTALRRWRAGLRRTGRGRAARQVFSLVIDLVVLAVFVVLWLLVFTRGEVLWL